MILRKDRHAVARNDAPGFERVRESVDALEHLRIGAARGTVDDRDLFAIHVGGSLEEIDRAQTPQVHGGNALGQHPMHFCGRSRSLATMVEVDSQPVR